MNKTNLEEVNKNPQGWDSYCQYTMAKWEKLLNSETCKERDIHSFLEMHPSMIPGAFGISLISGHNPLYSSVFSKPILPGYKFKIPDFMWIAICSDEINPVLIEIEEPNKKWLTKKSTPRTEFTQAYDQLIQWQEWFQKSYNLQSFLELYQINNAETRSKTIVPYYVLIYGRRDELTGNEGKRSAFNNKKNEEIMTYDRLRPSKDQSNYICIKLIKGKFNCVSFPPVVSIFESLIKDWTIIQNIDKCIRESNELLNERKRFLIERINYWKNTKNRSTLHIDIGE